MVDKLDEVALTCDQCQALRPEITALLRELREAVQPDGTVPDRRAAMANQTTVLPPLPN